MLEARISKGDISKLYRRIAPTYNLWRQYRREQSVFREEYQQRVANRDTRGRRGSFTALQQTYDAYKWSKIHEQDLDELAKGFNNAVSPTAVVFWANSSTAGVNEEGF